MSKWIKFYLFSLLVSRLFGLYSLSRLNRIGNDDIFSTQIAKKKIKQVHSEKFLTVRAYFCQKIRFFAHFDSK